MTLLAGQEYGAEEDKTRPFYSFSRNILSDESFIEGWISAETKECMLIERRSKIQVKDRVAGVISSWPLKIPAWYTYSRIFCLECVTCSFHETQTHVDLLTVSVIDSESRGTGAAQVMRDGGPVEAGQTYPNGWVPANVENMYWSP